MRAALFSKAVPVWLEGRDKEMNLTCGFRKTVDKPGETLLPVMLRIAASTIYRLYVNGSFAGHGPARGPHGYYRLDEWDITDRLNLAQNVIAIEVAGYNVNSFYVLNQPSFLQAELTIGGELTAYTSADANAAYAFQANAITERVQKVQRYSFQRTFIEHYRMDERYIRWVKALGWNNQGEPVKQLNEPIRLLPRGVSYPTFALFNAKTVHSQGTFIIKAPDKPYWRDRSLVDIGPQLAGYLQDELAEISTDRVMDARTISTVSINEPYKAADVTNILRQGHFQILDFGLNRTGLIGGTYYCESRTKIYITFDEILTANDVDFLRLGCANVIVYEFEPGIHEVETIEPYTLRYAKLIVLEGEARMESFHLRELVNPDTERVSFQCSNDALNDIFTAGLETFKQNATDLYMDCPSRERAGWLCDSYFTARVEYELTGSTKIEDNMFENYSLPNRFEHLPDGMLPMCYPADHDHGLFIPNWALFFVIELEEYEQRSGNRPMIDSLREKVYNLFEYFRPFLNEDGLLEKLDNWVFVEWSRANDLVQDVNYPSNMLYAGALASAGRIYGDNELIEQAERVRNTIRQQSFNGQFFVDNAVRVDGKLQLSGETTEVCQYYAFTFDVAAPDTYSWLWQTLVEQFGPDRKRNGAYPEVYPANAFIGNYLRLDLLVRYGFGQKALEQTAGYFHGMAKRTGTLWEHDSDSASCNHGFASHVVHWLYSEALGIKEVDHRNKRIVIQIAANGLDYCEGSLPAGDGLFRLQWRKTDNQIEYSVDAPEDYEVIQSSTNITKIEWS